MNDAPNAPFAIAFKHSTNLARLSEVAKVYVDLCAVFFLFSWVVRQATSGELRDANQRLWVRIVVVVD